MNATRPSLLISSVGWLNMLIGLAFVAFGVYALISGADAVATLFHLKGDFGKAAGQVLDAENADKVGAGADVFAKGLSGIIFAMVGIVAGCAIVQGLPHLLLGLGVLFRSNAARIFAILFAILALVQGIGCLMSTAQSGRFLYIGLFLLCYAILTFVALIGKRASIEFSGGLQPVADSANAPPGGDAMSTSQPERPVAVIALALLLVAATAAASIFGTLYYTSRPGSPFAQNPDPRDKDGAKKAPAIDDTKALAQYKPRLAEFHDAVLAGQIPRAAELLKNVDVDEPDEHGRTALMKASAKGNLRMAMFLLAMGAQLNQRDMDGATPLMHACDHNQAGVVGVFRAEGNTVAEITALRAQYHVSPKVVGLDVKQLLPTTFAMPPFEYFRAADKQGQTAFMRAALKGNYDAAEKLSGYALCSDSQGNTVLHILASRGDRNLVYHYRMTTYTQGGATFSKWVYSPTNDKTSWAWSCADGKQKNLADQEPWMVAAEKGHLDIVKHLLVKPTIDDLQQKDKSGKTALEHATANGHKEVAAYLMQLRDEVAATKSAEKDKDKK